MGENFSDSFDDLELVLRSFLLNHLLKVFERLCLAANHVQVLLQVSAAAHRRRRRHPRQGARFYHLEKWRASVFGLELLDEFVEVFACLAQERNGDRRIHRCERESPRRSLVISFVDFDLRLRFLTADASGALTRVRIEVENVVADVAEKIQRLIRSTADDAQRRFHFEELFETVDVNWIEFTETEAQRDDYENRLEL